MLNLFGDEDQFAADAGLPRPARGKAAGDVVPRLAPRLDVWSVRALGRLAPWALVGAQLKRRQTAHVYRPPTALDLTPQGKARQFAVLLHLRRPCAACGAALYTTVPYRSLQRLLRRDITRLGPLELVRCRTCRDANRVAARDVDPAVAHRRRLKAQQQARYRAKQRAIAQAQKDMA